MPYYIRLMHQQDIAQVSEIDQEAFPNMLPPANYERELRTRLAHYIVAGEASIASERTKTVLTPEQALPTPPAAAGPYLFGFAGFWMMADEAHITNIAVREIHRRRGIGELLLISLIDLALELGGRILSLEVRASNLAAQGLYYKYGLRQVGIRRGYYTDNKENALVMTAEDITSTSFQKRLHQLKQAHAQRWGIDCYQIAR
jgi:ribosomal-protein-alanine N-acetyltransferase